MCRSREIRRSFACAAAVLLAAVFASSGARAEDVSLACPTGNLLAGKAPYHWTDIRGRLPQVTDGVVAQEGAVWDAPMAVVLDTGASVITYDLGLVTKLAALYMQGDANDTYTVWTATERQGPWKKIGQFENVVKTGHGLRSRSLMIPNEAARYLRIGEGSGDDFYSLTEVQAFCQVPTPFPPKLTVGTAPTQKAQSTIYDYWNDQTSARWELVLALIAFGLLTTNHWLEKKGRAHVKRKLRDGLLGAIGIISFATYFNFGAFHFGNYIHNWDVFHYYVGSKYFRELHYDRLYECAAVADMEEGLGRRVELRKMTNLRTNVLEPSTEIFKHPEMCKRHFSPERWASFRQDVRFFRSREAPKRWDEAQTDHGYNATPVWNIAGTLLANTGPATHTRIFLLTLFDPIYLAAAMGLVWWAFGWRVLCVALAVFATNFPSRFYWTGGAFLRWDWIFYLVASICCLKKGRPLLGGFALGYSALLRVFPGFLFIGPVMAFAYHLWKSRAVDRTHFRFLAGGALAVALLVPASLYFSDGPQAYVRFVQNTRKHKETPLTNAMGLRTVISYRPKEVGRLLRSDDFVDPWTKWKAARLRAFEKAKAGYYVLVLLYLGLLGYAVRKSEPWVAAALSAGFCAIGVELTSYYYAFLIVPALLYAKREEVGRYLLLCTAFTQFIAWAPLGNTIFSNRLFKMSTWFDEQHTWYAFASVFTLFAIVWSFAEAAREPKEGGDGGAPAAAPELAATGAADASKTKKRR